jgi:hypothetical protein
MTIRPSIDVATRVSAELSAFIETLVNDPDRDGAPTLFDVRRALRVEGDDGMRETEYLHPHERGLLLVEVDDLIDEFGDEAPAIDFVSATASEALSRVIEAATADPRVPRVPTLGAVREVMAAGLIARLVGKGAIDEDDDGALLAEIDELIARYGVDALAENFTRFE